MFYLTTQFIYVYMEGMKEVFYLTTHSTNTVIWRQQNERNECLND